MSGSVDGDSEDRLYKRLCLWMGTCCTSDGSGEGDSEDRLYR